LRFWGLARQPTVLLRMDGSRESSVSLKVNNISANKVNIVTVKTSETEGVDIMGFRSRIGTGKLEGVGGSLSDTDNNRGHHAK